MERRGQLSHLGQLPHRHLGRMRRCSIPRGQVKFQSQGLSECLGQVRDYLGAGRTSFAARLDCGPARSGRGSLEQQGGATGKRALVKPGLSWSCSVRRVGSKQGHPEPRSGHCLFSSTVGVGYIKRRGERGVRRQQPGTRPQDPDSRVSERGTERG